MAKRAGVRVMRIKDSFCLDQKNMDTYTQNTPLSTLLTTPWLFAEPKILNEEKDGKKWQLYAITLLGLKLIDLRFIHRFIRTPLRV